MWRGKLCRPLSSPILSLEETRGYDVRVWVVETCCGAARCGLSPYVCIIWPLAHASHAALFITMLPTLIHVCVVGGIYGGCQPHGGGVGWGGRVHGHEESVSPLAHICTPVPSLDGPLALPVCTCVTRWWVGVGHSGGGVLKGVAFIQSCVCS